MSARQPWTPWKKLTEDLIELPDLVRRLNDRLKTLSVWTSSVDSAVSHNFGYATAPPTTGTYEVGDTYLNAAPASAGFMGWVCTAPGTPGTWTTWGPIT